MIHGRGRPSVLPEYVAENAGVRRLRTVAKVTHEREGPDQLASKGKCTVRVRAQWMEGQKGMFVGALEGDRGYGYG